LAYTLPCRAANNNSSAGKASWHQSGPSGVSWFDDFITEPEQEDDLQEYIDDWSLQHVLIPRYGFCISLFQDTIDSIHIGIGTRPMYIMFHKWLI